MERTRKIVLKKTIYHTIFALIVFVSCSVFAQNAKAQTSAPQTIDPPKPTTTQPAAPPPTTAQPTTQTVPTPTTIIATPTDPNQEPFNEPIIKPRIKKPRPRPLDSVQLAAINDSLFKAAQNAQLGANNSTATLSTDSVAKTQTEVPILTSSNNPFEILRGDSSATDSNMTKPKAILEHAAPSLLNRETYSKNFLFWIFLITLSFMALVVANTRSIVQDAYQAVSNNNSLRYVYRSQAGWGNIAQLALYGLFLINASIFTFLMYYRFVGKPPLNQFWTFIYCFLAVSSVFFIKHTVLYVIASVFPIKKEVRMYNFIIITTGILLGLILLPLNIFIAYSPEILGNLLTYIAFGAIGIVYLVRSLRGLSIASPFLATDQFHFLVYLCVVEMTPLLVLTKFLISK